MKIDFCCVCNVDMTDCLFITTSWKALNGTLVQRARAIHWNHNFAVLTSNYAIIRIVERRAKEKCARMYVYIIHQFSWSCLAIVRLFAYVCVCVMRMAYLLFGRNPVLTEHICILWGRHSKFHLHQYPNSCNTSYSTPLIIIHIREKITSHVSASAFWRYA